MAFSVLLLAATLVQVSSSDVSGLGTPALQIGRDGQAWGFVLGVDRTNGTVWARSASTSAIEFVGEASDVINQCVQALPYPGGGTIFLRSGVYTLASPVVIDRSSVEIRGENSGGDLFFTSDSFYNGFRNKTATVLVAVNIDAIQIGNGEVGFPMADLLLP